MAQQNLFTKTREELWETVIRLEEFGFECEEDEKDSLMCLHNKKRIAFRLSYERPQICPPMKKRK